MWRSPGFSKLTSNYTDLLIDEAANAEWCEFISQKIRSIVEDPETADKLIPKDHRFGEKRPPFVDRLLRGVQQPERVDLVDLEQTPIVRMTEDGIETTEGVRGVRHRRVGDRLRLRHRRARRAWGSGAVTVSRSWITGPTARGRSSASRPPDFPNFFFPGGPHAAAGNNPRYNGDQVDFIIGRSSSTLANTATTRSRWTLRPRTSGPPWSIAGRTKASPFGEISYYFGSNIPGKPRKYLLNSAGRPKLFAEIAKVFESDYKAFRLARVLSVHARGHAPDARPAQTVATGVNGEPTAPGRRSGGAVSRNRLRPCWRSHGRELVQVPHLAEGHAQPEEAEVVDREERVPALVAVLADHPLDRVVVRHQRRDLRVADPLQQRLVPSIEVGAHRVDLHGIRVAVPLEHLGGEPGVEQEHVTGLDDDIVGGHDLLERPAVDPPPFMAEVVGQVDEDASPLHARGGHVLQAQVVSEAAVPTAVAPARRASARPGPLRRGTRCSRPPPRSRPRRRRTRLRRGPSESHCVEYCSERVTTSSAHTSTYLGSPTSPSSLMGTL